MEGHCSAGTAECLAEKQGKVGGDHFMVEELLDFSNEEEEEEDRVMAAEEDGGSEENGGNCSVDSCDNSFGGDGGYLHCRFPDELVCRSLADVGLSGELCEPHDELAELEWLSNFVDDSFSGEELLEPHLISPQPTTQANAGEPVPFSTEQPVHGKVRTKRNRNAPSNWSSHLLLLSQSSGKRKPLSPAALTPPPDVRKCLHCGADKTPQWRTGPMGPKTLCNACGVRFKSGRLVPEYRPAASPTFVVSKHSNSHRKVIELRRQKDVKEQCSPVYHRAAAAAEDFRRVF